MRFPAPTSPIEVVLKKRDAKNIFHDLWSTVIDTDDAFGSERYVLTFDNHALRKTAQFAPYEFIEVLANDRTYGGGGIFNLYSTVAADNAFANYVFVHEFGHHFAGLADEYYTSSVAYAPATNRVEPWEQNVTALLDVATLKWRTLASPFANVFAHQSLLQGLSTSD